MYSSNQQQNNQGSGNGQGNGQGSQNLGTFSNIFLGPKTGQQNLKRDAEGNPVRNPKVKKSCIFHPNSKSHDTQECTKFQTPEGQEAWKKYSESLKAATKLKVTPQKNKEDTNTETTEVKH